MNKVDMRMKVLYYMFVNNRGKPLETSGRKARSLTGKPHDSSAAKENSFADFLFG